MAVMGSFHLVYFKWKLWEGRSVNVENLIPITRIKMNELFQIMPSFYIASQVS